MRRSHWPRRSHPPGRARSRYARCSSWAMSDGPVPEPDRLTDGPQAVAREARNRSAEARLAGTVRMEGARILATLIRSLGDLQLAEDAVQEATIAPLRARPTSRAPDNPPAWLPVP